MKQTPLKRYKKLKPSKAYLEELALRHRLKFELIALYGNRCMTCFKVNPWLLDLAHKIALSQGGETSKENCILECRDCHMKRHHLIREVNNER